MNSWGASWGAVLALQTVFGIIVFAATRHFYVDERQAHDPFNGYIAEKSSVSNDGTLEVSTMMLESLLELQTAQDDPATMSLLANEYFANNQYAEAAELYGQLSAIDPGNVNIMNNLGLTLHYINKSKEALVVLVNGSTLDPDNQRVWLTLGYVHKELGNLDEARRSLETAARLNPDSDVGRSALRMLNEL